ncbi:Fur family transcriptional regulator [Agromyces marinus]|uniref:Transcriptional repressor n=1 Tax=Agromyces marinus TaxID=1389020 RepID=A0ABN6YDF3_9MICO|nr:Fur family transcriptional regulator [Agromyces marinus]UIP59800.1 Transcriptional regulator FurA [Agromyces marinus]BDZ55116.1 transcriptional repressor [Agromyces marinus]
MEITATHDDAVARIRAAGLKVTAPRVAVLGIVEAGGHLDADAVRARVGETLPGTSLQSVYNVLGALTDAGLLRRIEPAESPALYESRTGDNHHHVVCTRCRAVADVDCVIGEPPCLVPADAAGFAIHTAEVTFWGLCANCRREPAG